MFLEGGVTYVKKSFFKGYQMCVTFEGQKVNLSKCYDKKKDEDAGLYCIIELLQKPQQFI